MGVTKRTRYALLALLWVFVQGAGPQAGEAPERPNILFFFTDDQSWPHAGAYGDAMVETPAFDRVAREGVLFQHAFVASPSCTQSRSAVLTGQAIWRLEEGGDFGGPLPSKFDVFPLMLEEAGYAVGWTGKGWGPGNLMESWGERNPLGHPYNTAFRKPRRDGIAIYSIDYPANFGRFLDEREDGQPFFFWCGTVQPHRPYPVGSGLLAGKRLEDVDVPPSLPDHPAIRSDLLDYALQIDDADAQLARMIAMLEEAGELDDTLIVVSSDNGMAFPRAKGQLYDGGVRVPLAIRWGRRVPGGRVLDDFVSLTDLAPTFLEFAGLEVPEAMTGRSLGPILETEEQGLVDPSRTWVVTSTKGQYPQRALRTTEHLYVRNLRHEEVPPSSLYYANHPFVPDVDRYVGLQTDPRGPEELYVLARDPGQVEDVATDPAHSETLSRLRGQLDRYLAATGDEAPGTEPPDGEGGEDEEEGEGGKQPGRFVAGYGVAGFPNFFGEGEDSVPVISSGRFNSFWRNLLATLRKRDMEDATAQLMKTIRLVTPGSGFEGRLGTLYRTYREAAFRSPEFDEALGMIDACRIAFEESRLDTLAIEVERDIAHAHFVRKKRLELGRDLFTRAIARSEAIGDWTGAVEGRTVWGGVELRLADPRIALAQLAAAHRSILARDLIWFQRTVAVDLVQAVYQAAREDTGSLWELADERTRGRLPELLPAERIALWAFEAAHPGAEAERRLLDLTFPGRPEAIGADLGLRAARSALDDGRVEDARQWLQGLVCEGPCGPRLAARRLVLEARAATVEDPEAYLGLAEQAVDAYAVLGDSTTLFRAVDELALLADESGGAALRARAAESLGGGGATPSGQPTVLPAEDVEASEGPPFLARLYEIRAHEGRIVVRDSTTGEGSSWPLRWGPGRIRFNGLSLATDGGYVSVLAIGDSPRTLQQEDLSVLRPLPEEGSLAVFEGGATLYVD